MDGDYIGQPRRAARRCAWWMVALAAATVALEGCAPTAHLTRPPAEVAAPERFGPLSPQQQNLVDENCYAGLPVDRRESVGSTELIVRRGYVLEHSSTDKIPLWVCESVWPAQLTGRLVRSNRFRPDPDLQGPKSYPQDYARSGYDRGHQAPAGNQTVDATLKEETFYMSNMAPQRPSLNRGIWKALEDKTREWVVRYGHAYEWTGSVRCDGTRCQRRTIGVHGVAVPRYFYKIILVQEQGAWKGIAFLLPNADFQAPYRLDPYRTSIGYIESLTGIEFMPRMERGAREALRDTIPPMWP